MIVPGQSHPGSFFDRRAARYDAAYEARGADGHALRARMAKVLELLGGGPGAVLDAGMGGGRLCAELAERGWTVSGIDRAGRMVGLAQARLPDAAERLSEGDIHSLSYPDETFDAVVATGVLEYVEVERALAELARVLRPGGRAVVSYPNPHALYGLWKTRVFYRLVGAVKRAAGRRDAPVQGGSGGFPPERFRSLLSARGLRPDYSAYASFLVLPSPLDAALPGLAERLGRRLEGGRPRLGRLLATQVVYRATKAIPPTSAGRETGRGDLRATAT